MESVISGLIGWVPVIGGVILGIALLWGLYTNSRQPRREVDQSERAAKDLREELDREAKVRGED